MEIGNDGERDLCRLVYLVRIRLQTLDAKHVAHFCNAPNRRRVCPVDGQPEQTRTCFTLFPCASLSAEELGSTGSASSAPYLYKTTRAAPLRLSLSRLSIHIALHHCNMHRLLALARRLLLPPPLGPEQRACLELLGRRVHCRLSAPSAGTPTAPLAHL
jgi:hypothetical protein